MNLFNVTIVCLNLMICSSYPKFSFFEAENVESCERNIQLLLTIQGFELTDFNISCSLERRA